MKRIIYALLSVFINTPCFSNIHIHSDIVKSTIKKYISNQDDQLAALAEYNAHVKKSNNTGIPAYAIWQVCKAAGWNIQTVNGELKCREFGNALMKYAIFNFKEVCGRDKFMVGRGTGRCIDNVFSNNILGGVKVNVLGAIGLAKEYARIKYNDKDLICSRKYRQTTFPPDDYIQCLSMNKNIAYEFRFDSVTTTIDSMISEGIDSGVCKIFGLIYSPFGSQQEKYLGNGKQINSYQSWSAACETTDEKLCNKVNESITKFGHYAKIGLTGSKGNTRTACVINENSISSQSKLRTAFGIDNYVFRKSGVQLNATQSLKTQICSYIRTIVKNKSITSCDCNDGFTKLYNFSGMLTEIDNILTCKINGENIDFVFDDLSETNKKIANGSSQGMDCIAAGGTYAGQQCMYLDEKQCKILANINLGNCEFCKKIEYKNGICQLPSGSDAMKVEKKQKIAIIIGGAVIGGVITFLTAGKAVPIVILTLLETGGAVIEYKSQVKIDAITDEFLLTSQKCKSSSCAEKLVKQNLQRLSNLANDMQTAEQNAVDKELARLVGLLPNNSQLFIDIIIGEDLLEANHKKLLDSDSWEPEQVWRAIGVALQMTSIFTSVGKWILKSPTVLAKDLPETTIKMTKKIKSTKIEVQKILSINKEIKTSNGQIVKIPDYANPINPDIIGDAAVRQIYENAYNAERRIITDDMLEATSKAGGNLSGLEYRMKTPESMMEKIARDRAAGEVAEGVSDVDIAARFSDVVRYTQIGSKQNLKEQIIKTLSELESRGYRINKIKNRLNNNAGTYKDVMVQLEHVETGQKIELQFNTQKNLILKEEGHKFYEITRDINKTQEERDAAQKSMEQIYMQLEIPDEIIGFTYK